MGAVHEAIKDGVGDCGVIKPGVPMINRQPIGDECRLAGAAIIDDLKQIVLSLLIQRSHSPIVKDQGVDAGQLHEHAKAAIGMPET